MRSTIIALAGLVGLLASGCAPTMNPVTSKPPEAKILVKAVFESKTALLDPPSDFPAGEYRPVYENSGGYFFQAPAKIALHSCGLTILEDGGLYFDRATNEPTNWYLLPPDGSFARMGSLDTRPQFERIP